MADTTYEIEMVQPEPDLFPGRSIPVIARIISVDGVEVSRGYPEFNEVTAAQPDIIEAYFDAMKEYLSDMLTFIDAQTSFSDEQAIRLSFLASLCDDFRNKYTPEMPNTYF